MGLPPLRVGFIGLGHLGEPMAAQVAKAGFDLSVFDVRADPVRRLEGLGAKAAESVEALARSCEVILVAVVDERQVTDVLLGGEAGQGVVPVADPGTIVVVHSTIHPDACRRLSEVAAGRGIDVLDAPVTGGPDGAQSGSLSIMVGGSATALRTCQPVLESMGEHISRLGDSGSGQLAKIANNVGLAITMTAVREALALAGAAGIDPPKMLELLSLGACDSWVVRHWATIGTTATNYQAGGPRGVARLTYKDLALALSIAQGLDLSLPATGVTAQLLTDAYLSAADFADRHAGGGKSAV